MLIYIVLQIGFKTIHSKRFIEVWYLLQFENHITGNDVKILDMVLLRKRILTLILEIHYFNIFPLYRMGI